ncbi:MAG: NCS2 family permease [Clostridia bacterium]|nr:NCS2 family permease [Clostridia bacterium]
MKNLSIFKLKENKARFFTEILAGITTFITMAYIVVVNPSIIAGAPGSDLYTSVFVATCLAAFFGTLLTALIANLPFAQASGMGLNAFFAFTVMGANGYSYPAALLIVFISGMLFILITVVGLREAVIKAIPKNVKTAISAGIGLFIAFIGLVNSGSGIVVNDESTLLGLVDFSGITDVANPATMHSVFSALVIIVGLVVIGVLHRFKVPGAILLGIAASACAYWFGGLYINDTLAEVVRGNLPGNNIEWSTIGTQFGTWAKTSLGVCFTQGVQDLFGNGTFMDNLFTIVMVIISFSMVDMFDTVGTLIGTAQKANMIDEKGNMPRMKEALLSDSIATAAGAVLGTSTVTTFVESSAGVSVGGRTGLTSLVTSLGFLVALFLSPFIGYIPGCATAPALIFVGILMISSVKDLDFDDITEAIPAFVTLTFMPLTYSIANGIAFGLITHLLLKVLTFKFKDISIVEIILVALFIVKFVLG